MKEDYEYVIEKFVLPAIPPPGPTLFSREWFDSIKPLPLLPPVAQFRFPFNFVGFCYLTTDRWPYRLSDNLWHPSLPSDPSTLLRVIPLLCRLKSLQGAD